MIKSLTKPNYLELQVDTNQGLIRFEAKQEENTFYYYSPWNGAYKYYFNEQNKRFVNNKDQHLLEEWVARDVVAKMQIFIDI